MIKIVMCVRRRRDREMAADEARFLDLASLVRVFHGGAGGLLRGRLPVAAAPPLWDPGLDSHVSGRRDPRSTIRCLV